jgi:C-terminal processing protease CtpA/Prc
MLSFVFWAILSLLLVLTVNALGCVGFGMQASPLSQCTSRRRLAQKKGSHSHLSSHRAMTLKLAKALSDDDTSATIVTKSAESYFVDAEFFELQISPHRPLGCTVEESLGEGRHVFVSKVVPDGNAAKAGIAVGDVLIGVTAVTGDQKMDVSGLGIETM